VELEIPSSWSQILVGPVSVDDGWARDDAVPFGVDGEMGGPRRRLSFAGFEGSLEFFGRRWNWGLLCVFVGGHFGTVRCELTTVNRRARPITTFPQIDINTK